MLIALVLFAQVWAQSPQRGYTTFDPSGLGLATPDGRYELAVDPACGIAPLTNVVYWADAEGWYMDALDGSTGCAIASAQQIGTVPCFLNDAGVCDVAEEHN